jgi:hypothetical protein
MLGIHPLEVLGLCAVCTLARLLAGMLRTLGKEIEKQRGGEL